MAAASQRSRQSEELPALQLGVLVRAVGAVALEGTLLDSVQAESGSKGANLDEVVTDIEEHLAGDQGAGALVGVAVEDDGRALDAPAERDG